MKDQHFQEIVIGALLHDIGKVVQRSRDDPARARHQEFGKGWFDDLPQDTKDYLGHEVSDYILRHHLLSRADPKRDLLDASVPGRGDLLLVCEADNLSAGERKEDPDEEGVLIPVISFDGHCQLTDFGLYLLAAEENLEFFQGALSESG